jgi:hypothetical protein
MDAGEIHHLEVELRAEAKTLMPLDRRMPLKQLLERFSLIELQGQRVQRLQCSQYSETLVVA